MTYVEKNSFFVLHEEMVKAAEKHSGGLDRSRDYKFYGYESASNDPHTIARVVHDVLMEKRYHFRGFRLADDGFVFNGEVLRKAKNRYNAAGNASEVQIEDAYLDALLTFLDLTPEKLEAKAADYPVRDRIDHTNTTKPKRNPAAMTSKSNFSQHDKDQYSIVKEHLCDRFYLYSYNEEYYTIFRAILEIKPHENSFRIDLKNSPGFYNYTGMLDYSMIHNYTARVPLQTYLRNKGLHIMLRVNLNLKGKAEIYLGQMTRIGDYANIVTSDIFVERITGTEGKPDTFELKNTSKKPPVHVQRFFDPSVYNKIERIQFHKNADFIKWLDEKQKKGRVPFF